MAIKVYSDKTGKFYNTVDEANRAEFELKEKENLAKIQKEREEALAKEKKEKAAAERKAAAEEVETARKAMVEAQNAYQEKLKEFIDKYHSYHFTSTNPADIPVFFSDFFDKIFPF